MKSNVRNYTDQELLDRVASLQGFKGFPKDFWMIWVRSTEDSFNRFDDKRYLFKGEKFIQVAVCTTNAGKNGLKGFESYNSDGCAVLKSDILIYEGLGLRKHRNKVMAYCQRKPFPYYRDNDKDDFAEEIGEIHNNIIGANFHPSSYIKGNTEEKEFINGWSLACLTDARRTDFDKTMNTTNGQKKMSFALLKEF